MAALVLLSRAVGLLPWRWLRVPGALIGALVGSLLRIRRRQVEGAMLRAGVEDVPATARRDVRVARHGALRVPVDDRPASVAGVRGALHRPGDQSALGSSGRGIATAHTANWDLVACAAAQGHLPLTVITKRLSAEWLDRIWQSERAARGIELLDGAGVFGRAVDSIARERGVAVLIDQAPSALGGRRAPFLGEKARCDMMAALLAARTGANLVLALGCRQPDGMYVVDVPLVLEPPPRATRAWAEQATREPERRARGVRPRNPAQWLWLHRRWKPLSRAHSAGRPSRAKP